MDILINILIFLHLFGLVIGMGSGIALSRIGPLYGTSSEEQRKLLFRLAMMLGKNGHIGLGLLWITGPLVVWLKFGTLDLGPWFWAKMVLVVILSASIGMGSAAFRKFAAGDMAASARVALTSRISGLAGLLIILTAVFAFNQPV